MEYLTLSEAATLTGKTLITVRRLAKKPGSKAHVKLEAGKLYISKPFLLSKYPAVTTQEATQTSTQVDPEEHTQEPGQTTQDEQNQRTQPVNLDTQMLIEALKMQYEGRIQDLKTALESKEKEIERMTVFFDQQQKLDMARTSLLPAKTSNYPDAQTIETGQDPVVKEPVPELLHSEELPNKKKWWQFF